MLTTKQMKIIVDLLEEYQLDLLCLSLDENKERIKKISAAVAALDNEIEFQDNEYRLQEFSRLRLAESGIYLNDDPQKYDVGEYKVPPERNDMDPVHYWANDLIAQCMEAGYLPESARNIFMVGHNSSTKFSITFKDGKWFLQTYDLDADHLSEREITANTIPAYIGHW
jgi:hypothetical protein